jgi:hypothetical protein
MAPVVAFNKLMVSAPFEIPSSGRPGRSANKVDLPAPMEVIAEGTAVEVNKHLALGDVTL